MNLLDCLNQYAPLGNLMAGIGAIVGCGFALYTSKCLKEQIINSYKPFIVVLENRIDLYFHTLDSYGAIRKDIYNKEEYRLFKKEYLEKGPSIFKRYKGKLDITTAFSTPCVNVGNNVAKKVTIKWEWDINKAVDIIKKIDDVGIEIEACGFLIRFHEEAIRIWTNNMDSPIKLKPIMPYVIDKYDSTSEITLPSYYTDFRYAFEYITNKISDICAEINVESPKWSSLRKEIPPLLARLSYEDIAGNKYNQCYCFNLKEDTDWEIFISGVENLETYLVEVE